MVVKFSIYLNGRVFRYKYGQNYANLSDDAHARLNHEAQPSRGSKRRSGPVVQSVVTLTSSLVVKILTVLVSTISNSQLILLKKCE